MDIDLEGGTINRSYMNHNLGEGDQKGNRFGVRVFRNGQSVDLTGVSVSGYFIRANGTTVSLSGSRSGNKCYVTLAAACYAVEGSFTLVIKLTGGGITATARIVDGTIVDTAIGELVDPGSLIPDLSDFTDLVERVEAAAEKIESFDITAVQITGTRYKLGVIEAS